MHVCVFQIQRTNVEIGWNKKKTIVLALPQIPLTITEHRIQMNTALAVILSLAFFVCILCSFTLPPDCVCSLLFLFIHFSFHFTSLKRTDQTTICLKVNSIWCGLHARLFYDFRRMCFKCSALNMVERSRTLTWVSVCIALQAHCVCISYLHTGKTFCCCCSAMHRTEALWDHSTRTHTIQCTPITSMCLR